MLSNSNINSERRNYCTLRKQHCPIHWQLFCRNSRRNLHRVLYQERLCCYLPAPPVFIAPLRASLLARSQLFPWLPRRGLWRASRRGPWVPTRDAPSSARVPTRMRRQPAASRPLHYSQPVPLYSAYNLARAQACQTQLSLFPRSSRLWLFPPHLQGRRAQDPVAGRLWPAHHRPRPRAKVFKEIGRHVGPRRNDYFVQARDWRKHFAEQVEAGAAEVQPPARYRKPVANKKARSCFCDKR